VNRVAEGKGFETPVPFPVQRFSTEPFGKFSTLLLFPTGYKSVDLIRGSYKTSALNVELLQFYYRGFSSR